jgi:hypothetical protein
MTNRWIEYVKKFAKDNNLSYGCALSDPNLRKGYVPTGNKAKAKRQDEEREKRQDDEEARVSAIKKKEEKQKFFSLVKADPGTQPTKDTEKQQRHKEFIEKYKDNSELLRKDLGEALNPNKKETELIGKLHDEYLRLNKMPYSKKVGDASQEVQEMANKLIRPILKKQLEVGFFPTEKDKKYGEMKFNVASYVDRYRGGKVKKIFEFFLDGKKIDEDDIGSHKIHSEWYDPYRALYYALEKYYRYRFFGNVAGMRNFEEFMKFTPKPIKE